MRTFAAVTAGGVLTIALLKLFAAVVMPVVGLVLGVLATGVKLLFFAAVGYLIYALFFKRKRREGEVG